MLTGSDKRKHFEKFRDDRALIIGAILKCSVCVFVVALLVVISMQAPDGSFDTPQRVAASGHSVMPVLYVK